MHVLQAMLQLYFLQTDRVMEDRTANQLIFTVDQSLVEIGRSIGF